MRSYASRSTQIDVEYMHGISGFSACGRSHDEIANTPKTASDRAAELSATLAWQAEERYDAFCPFGTLDIGVPAARAAGVKIPVVGQAEASIVYCGLLGSWRTEILGLDGLYTGPTAIGIPNSECPARHAEVLGRFVRPTSDKACPHIRHRPSHSSLRLLRWDALRDGPDCPLSC